jgi:hypothetical protein
LRALGGILAMFEENWIGRRVAREDLYEIHTAVAPEADDSDVDVHNLSLS